MSADRKVVELANHDALGLDDQQSNCANPRCDVQFMQPAGPGRRRDFHDDECRRLAEKDLRRTTALLEHHERQVEQLRARAAAYTRTTTESEGNGHPTVAQEQAARDAILEVRGMARFLENHQGEFAADLLKLARAVEPLLRS